MDDFSESTVATEEAEATAAAFAETFTEAAEKARAESDDPVSDAADALPEVGCAAEGCAGTATAGGYCQEHVDAALAPGTAEVPAETPAEGPAEDQAAAPPTAKVAAEAYDRIPVRRYTRKLKTPLDALTLVDAKDELVAALAKHTTRKKQVDALKKDLATELKELWANVSRLQHKVESASEDREVECEEYRDDRMGTIVTVRLDTFQRIDERPQDVEERQLPLPKTEKADDDGDADAAGTADDPGAEASAEDVGPPDDTVAAEDGSDTPPSDPAEVPPEDPPKPYGRVVTEMPPSYVPVNTRPVE